MIDAPSLMLIEQMSGCFFLDKRLERRVNVSGVREEAGGYQ